MAGASAGRTDGGSIGDLREAIAAALGIPPAAQELRSGFPPQVVTASEASLVSAVLGDGARVLVKAAAPLPAAAQPNFLPSGGGGGRKKPIAVQRLTEGVAPDGDHSIALFDSSG